MSKEKDTKEVKSETEAKQNIVDQAAKEAATTATLPKTVSLKSFNAYKKATRKEIDNLLSMLEDLKEEDSEETKQGTFAALRIVQGQPIFTALVGSYDEVVSYVSSTNNSFVVAQIFPDLNKSENQETEESEAPIED